MESLYHQTISLVSVHIALYHSSITYMHVYHSVFHELWYLKKGIKLSPYT